jgi:hypothetical protein
VRRAIGFGDWNLECSRKPINRIPPMLTCMSMIDTTHTLEYLTQALSWLGAYVID